MANSDFKATLITKGGMGNIVVKHVKLLEYGRRAYAQYKSAPFVRYIEKGKRKEAGFVQGYKPYLVILDGWQDIKSQDFFSDEKEVGNGVVIQTGKYASFDERWVQDFEKNVEFKDILADYRNVNTMESEGY